VAHGEDFVDFGGAFLRVGHAVRAADEGAPSAGAVDVRVVSGNGADCADSGVAVCAVFRAFGLDGHSCERRVGVHLGICGLGHWRDGRFGARRAGID